MSFFRSFNLDLSPWLQALIGVAILLTIAILAYFIVRKILLKILWHVLDVIEVDMILPLDDLLPVGKRLANIVPTVIIARGLPFVPDLPEMLVTVTQNVCAAFVVLTIALAINTGLNVLNDIYMRRPDAAQRPIKGYIQLLKIVVFLGAGVLVIAALMEQSPLLLLSGLGAMAAVLLLVFKDTILSLVASVQLTSNDMLRVGDWIEMPKLDADGDVVDIALHTVKVQNWDKTITTIPTHRLISESFKNWRGMKEAGGRRIRRPLLLDQNSVRFMDEADKARLHQFRLLGPYLDDKARELADWNVDRDPDNSRRLTNIGTFRAYVLAYLRAHPQVRQDLTLLVRQLEPTADGLPLEVYCFTNTTVWAEYESIQADIFDHLIALLPEFGLKLFQKPTGMDLRELAEHRAD